MISKFNNFIKEQNSFNQEIKITVEDFVELNSAIKREIDEDFPFIKDYLPNGNKEEARMYLKPLDVDSNILEINTTQCRFIGSIIDIDDCDKRTTLIIKNR